MPLALIPRLRALAALQCLSMPDGCYQTTHEAALDTLQDVLGVHVSPSTLEEILCYLDGLTVRQDGDSYTLGGQACSGVSALVEALREQSAAAAAFAGGAV